MGKGAGHIACSMDVKQAFDHVSPEALSLAMKEMDIAPMFAGAIMREQIGARYDICFQETRVSEIKSINQGWKESPCLSRDEEFVQTLTGENKECKGGNQDEDQ